MKNIKELPWNQQFALAWAKMQPPARPNLNEQGFYETIIKKVIKNNPRAKILILGSTPELRDIIIKNKITPVCCDISSEVFRSLRIIMKRHGQERFILSDWTELNLKQRFDLILGHQVINMLPLKKQSKLIETVHNHLKPGGIFVQSVVLRASQDKNISLLTGFKRYRRLGKRFKKFAFSIIHPDLLLSISKKTGTYSPKDCLNIVERLYKFHKINKEERDAYFKVMPPSDLRVYIPTKKIFEKLTKKYFRIKLIYCPKSIYYDSRHWPIYVLNK